LLLAHPLSTKASSASVDKQLKNELFAYYALAANTGRREDGLMADDIPSARDRHPHFIVLRDVASQDLYDRAVEAFARGGSRQDLMTQLMALGMTVDEIRWHCESPGRRKITIVEE
jgi:hypothetical protein